MNRAQKYFSSLPKGAYEVKTIEREWGIERIYKSSDGQEYLIPESLLFSSDVS